MEVTSRTLDRSFLWGCVRLFEQKIYLKCISFAKFAEEQMEAKVTFSNETGFLGVLGFDDGTHISSCSHTKRVPHSKREFRSLNAMIFCDHKIRIRSIDARYEGAPTMPWSGVSVTCGDTSKAVCQLLETITIGFKGHWISMLAVAYNTIS